MIKDIDNDDKLEMLDLHPGEKISFSFKGPLQRHDEEFLPMVHRFFLHSVFVNRTICNGNRDMVSLKKVNRRRKTSLSMDNTFHLQPRCKRFKGEQGNFPLTTFTPYWRVHQLCCCRYCCQPSVKSESSLTFQPALKSSSCLGIFLAFHVSVASVVHQDVMSLDSVSEPPILLHESICRKQGHRCTRYWRAHPSTFYNKVLHEHLL
ncbi:hypothetical protein STEG23_017400 [Scotinomys teguina]